jgi:hypothetical protein
MSQEDPLKKLSPTEQRENPSINFVRIFKDKLASIEELTVNPYRQEIIRGLDQVGIKKVKKLAPAEVFRIETSEGTRSGFNLWIENDKDCDIKYPHTDVRPKLEDFLRNNKREDEMNYNNAFIIQDEQNEIHLIVNQYWGENIQSYMRMNYKYRKELLQKYLDFIDKYGIKQIIGKMAATEEEKEERLYGSKNVRLLDIDFDLVGQIREDRYLYSFAEKYQMTNTQYLRFWLKATAALEAEKQKLKNPEDKRGIKYITDLDTLAKESIAEDKEEGRF